MGLHLIADCSNNNGPVDFAALRSAGVEGVFCKVTEGLGFNDAYFAQDWAQAKAVGMWTGAYHFADFADPVREAQHYLAHMRSVEGVHDLVPALDVEAAFAGDANGWCNTWMGVVDPALARHSMPYSGSSWISAHGLWLPGRLLWEANYPNAFAHSSAVPTLVRPAGLRGWGATMWQFSESHRVAGVELDMSVTDDLGLFLLTNAAVPSPGVPLDVLEDLMPSIRVPAPSELANPPKLSAPTLTQPAGKTFAEGTHLVLAGRKGRVVVTTDRFETDGAAVRLQLGVGPSWQGDVGAEEFIPNVPQGWAFDAKPVDRLVSCVNFGPSPVTLHVVYDA